MKEDTSRQVFIDGLELLKHKYAIYGIHPDLYKDILQLFEDCLILRQPADTSGALDGDLLEPLNRDLEWSFYPEPSGILNVKNLPHIQPFGGTEIRSFDTEEE